MPELTHHGETLAAPLRRHLLQHFPADRAYSRSALRAEGMPPPIAAFLARTLDRWVEMERDRFREDWASSDWFDAEDTDVQRTEAAFFDALGRSARVPAAAWTDTLGGAVDLVVRFLTVPARALTDAIFEGAADPLPADVVRTRLPLFSAYPYLADIATAYLDRKQPEDLDPSDLFALLDRIDRRFVSEFDGEDWIALLAPLFALARHVPSLDGIHASLLRRFFDAKGEDDIVDLLAEYDESVLDEAALRKVLASTRPEAPAAEASDATADPEPETLGPEPGPVEAVVAEPEAVEAEPEVFESVATEPEQDPAEAEPEAAEPGTAEPEPSEPISADDAPTERTATESAIESGTVKGEDLGAPDDEPDATPDPSDTEAPNDLDAGRPLWERFAESTSDGDSVNARFGTSESDPTADAAPEEDADAVPLWKRFFARPETKSAMPATVEQEDDTPAPTGDDFLPAEPTPAQTADSLDALEQRVLGPMPPAQRRRFIKNLFSGDAGKYVTVLHGLDGADSWTEASQIIARDVFRPSRINIYGEHAIAFTDAVEARFRT